MRNQFRAHYLLLANRASEEPEPSPQQTPVTPDVIRGPASPFPPDLPDWDWPDAPDPRVNDIASYNRDRHFAWGWLATCTAITLGSLTYLIWQAL